MRTGGPRRLGHAAQCDRKLGRRLELQVGLRDLDALLAEFVQQSQADVALDVGDAVARIVDPEAQLQVQRTVAEALNQADQLRLPEYARRFVRSLLTERDRPADINAVGDADRSLRRTSPASLKVPMIKLCLQRKR